MLSRAFVTGFLIFVMTPLLTAKERILLNRIGPFQSRLFISKGDGSEERPLLAVSGFDYNASFSSDGKWIVFTSERNGSADIYRVRTDGTGLERLTDDPAYDDQAVLSPDGEQLTFVSTRGAGTADIWLLDLKTGKARNLTNGSGGNFRPSWSPDGNWIAFSSDRNTPVQRALGRWEQLQEASLYMMRPDGTGLRRLTPPGRFAGAPKWSPRGDVIAFTSFRDGDFDIYMIRPDGTGLKRLTTAPGNDAHPVWSPDGDHILFSSSRLGFKDEAPLYDAVPQPYAELFVMNADGSGQRPLTDNQWEEGTPAWEPHVGASAAKRPVDQGHGHYAEVHGFKMYYEVRGQGRPVVLLHGGMNTIQTSFAKQVPVFAPNHRVIAIEQMGHGHTADVQGRELSYESMTEDTAALLAQRGIRDADGVGWSDVGQLALRLAFTHPELVRRVVVSGVGFGATTPELQKAVRELSPDEALKEAHAEFARVSPDGPQHWPILFEKGRAMWAKASWGISQPELARIKAPTLIIAGDQDILSVEETTRIFRSIPNAKLCILPGTGHETFQTRPDWLNPVILDFLDRN
jgi:Tol biopolymer transport system component/pimeloyl-ACP methyl ester carboxylesterase